MWAAYCLTRALLSPLAVSFRVPEAQLKSIVWQTLQAINFCHKHNVSTAGLCRYNPLCAHSLCILRLPQVALCKPYCTYFFPLCCVT